MDIYEEIMDQMDILQLNGGKDIYVSFSRAGLDEVLSWFYSSMVIPTMPLFTSIEQFLGCTIIVNPWQKERVVVLMCAEDEFLYGNLRQR